VSRIAARPDTDALTGDPSPWIVRFAPLVAGNGRVLDVACGQGRHSVFFAARGCIVTAVDRNAAALAVFGGGVGITPLVADIEAGPWPLPGERFDAVIVTNYLHRALLPELIAAVAADGVLLYETFARGNEACGKPSNPDFLLAPGELLTAVGDRLTVVAYEQGVVTSPRAAVLQRVAAVGRGRPWPPALPA
jgi:SAM-dependent methyltransferase